MSDQASSGDKVSQAASLGHDSADPALPPRALVVAFFGALFVALSLAFGWLLLPFLSDFILAFLLSTLALPYYRRLLLRLGEHRNWLASTLVCLVLVVLIALPCAFLIGSLSSEAAHLYQYARAWISAEELKALFFGEHRLAVFARNAAQRLGVEYTPESLIEMLRSVSGTVAEFIYKNVNALVANVALGIYHFIVIIVLVFYLLLDGPALKRFILRLSPLPDAEEEQILSKLSDVGKATLFGNGVGSVAQGIIGGVSMAIVGLPSPVLWGTVMSILAFLPMVGISAVAIPAALYLMLTGRFWAGAIFLIISLTQAFVIENIVKTRMMGNQMQMHNLLILLSILGGLQLFGVLGILYGPLLSALFLVFVELYQNRYKNGCNDTATRN